MNKKSGTSKDAADKLIKGIKRKTRKHYSAEEKIGQRVCDRISTREFDDGSSSMVVRPLWLAVCVATTSQPDAPPTFKPPGHQIHS
jgi:hypothetical protein